MRNVLRLTGPALMVFAVAATSASAMDEMKKDSTSGAAMHSDGMKRDSMKNDAGHRDSMKKGTAKTDSMKKNEASH